MINISFVIAGAAVLLSLFLFSLILSHPVRKIEIVQLFQYSPASLIFRFLLGSGGVVLIVSVLILAVFLYPERPVLYSSSPYTGILAGMAVLFLVERADRFLILPGSLVVSGQLAGILLFCFLEFLLPERGLRNFLAPLAAGGPVLSVVWILLVYNGFRAFRHLPFTGYSILAAIFTSYLILAVYEGNQELSVFSIGILGVLGGLYFGMKPGRAEPDRDAEIVSLTGFLAAAVPLHFPGTFRTAGIGFPLLVCMIPLFESFSAFLQTLSTRLSVFCHLNRGLADRLLPMVKSRSCVISVFVILQILLCLLAFSSAFYSPVLTAFLASLVISLTMPLYALGMEDVRAFRD